MPVAGTRSGGGEDGGSRRRRGHAGGSHRLGNPPLALDLHFLLSAYSGADLHAEILLGYAMQLMHEFPLITREMIRTALNPSPEVGLELPPALRALADCGLADQVEQLRITPQFLNGEEMSRLWTAIQANYRPSAAYQVSVVLIEAQQAKENAIWRVAFARLGVASFNESYDHAPIWQGSQHQPTQHNYFNEHVRLPGNSPCFSCD